MTALSNLLADGPSSLALTILLQSSVLLSLGLLCGWMLRKRSASLRCLAARAMLCSVALSVCSAFVTAGKPMPWSVAVPSLRPRLVASVRPQEQEEAARPAEPGEIQAPTDAPAQGSASTWSHESPPVRQPEPDLGGVAHETSTSMPQVQVLEPIAAPSWETIGRAAIAIWLGGVALGLGWLAVGQFQVRRLRRRAAPVADAMLVAHRQVLACGHKRAPAVLESADLGAGEGPFLCGLLRPAIMLPRGLAASLEPQALRAVLAHEAAHARRRDLWWSTLARVCCVTLWPQPLMWMLARRLEAAQEEACDQAVLQAGCAPSDYASCLLSLAERLQARPLRRASGLSVVPSRSNLARRVRQILGEASDAPPSRIARAGAATGAVAALILSLGLAVGEPTPAQVLAGEPDQPSQALSPLEVAGVVLDADGRAVKNAQVAIATEFFGVRDPKLLTRRTDARGRFRFPDSLGGVREPGFECGAFVYAPGFGFRNAYLRAGHDATIRLQREVRVRGVVRDQAGRPVAGVPVRLYSAYKEGFPVEFGYPEQAFVPESLKGVLTVRTDAFGRYEIPGAPALKTALVNIDDVRFVRRLFPVAVGVGPVVATAPPQVLRRAASITGRLLRPDGQPAPGVVVSASNGGQDAPGEYGLAKTVAASDGSYRLGSLAPGVFRIETEDPSGALVTRPLRNIVVKFKATSRAPELKMQRGGLVRGRFLDADSGLPVGRVSVGCTDDGVYVTATSDAQGRYALRLPAGKSSIYVKGVPRGYLYPSRFSSGRKQDITLREGESQTLTVRLKKGLSIRGVAVDARGHHPAQAILMAESIPAPRSFPDFFSQQNLGRIEEDGSWSIESLPPGRYGLEARGDWKVVEPREFTVPAPSGQAPLRVVMRAVKQPSVQGRVLAQGRPLAGAVVRIHVSISLPSGAGMSYIERRLSDSAGAFRLDSLDRRAQVRLEATKAGYKYLAGGQVTRRETEAGIVLAARDIILAPGQSAPKAHNGPDLPPRHLAASRPVALSPARRAQLAAQLQGTASIRGRVLFDDGRPARTTVQLEAVGREAEALRRQLNWRSSTDAPLLKRLRIQVSTRADGTFEARELAAFTWGIEATNAPRGFLARRVPEVTARDGASLRARDIVLVRGGVIRVRLADAQTGQALDGSLVVGYTTQPRFNNIVSSGSVTQPGKETGVFSITVPPGMTSFGLWRGHDGKRPQKKAYAGPTGSGLVWTYDLSQDNIEVALGNGPRQKKRDGRLNLPITPGQTRDVTFFLPRRSTQRSTSP